MEEIKKNPSQNQSAADLQKRRGRPRKEVGTLSDADKKILRAARKVFREQGYNQATLSNIAKEAGIATSTIYYHYASKEEILSILYDFTIDAALVQAIKEIDEPIEIRLGLIVFHDVIAKCHLPFDFFEMEEAANASKNNTLQRLQAIYGLLYETLLEILKEGVKQGRFDCTNIEQEAILILSACDGLQHQYHAKNRGVLLVEKSGHPVADFTPVDIGATASIHVIRDLIESRVNEIEFLTRILELYCSMRYINFIKYGLDPRKDSIIRIAHEIAEASNNEELLAYLDELRAQNESAIIEKFGA